MSTLVNISSAPPASTALPPHPLEPLSADEVRAAVELLKKNGKVTPTTRFVSVALKEPDKSYVHGHGGGSGNGQSPPREAFAVLFDNATNSCLRGHALA